MTSPEYRGKSRAVRPVRQRRGLVESATLNAQWRRCTPARRRCGASTASRSASSTSRSRLTHVDVNACPDKARGVLPPPHRFPHARGERRGRGAAQGERTHAGSTKHGRPCFRSRQWRSPPAGGRAAAVAATTTTTRTMTQTCRRSSSHCPQRSAPRWAATTNSCASMRAWGLAHLTSTRCASMDPAAFATPAKSAIGRRRWLGRGVDALGMPVKGEARCPHVQMYICGRRSLQVPNQKNSWLCLCK